MVALSLSVETLRFTFSEIKELHHLLRNWGLWAVELPAGNASRTETHGADELELLY